MLARSRGLDDIMCIPVSSPSKSARANEVSSARGAVTLATHYISNTVVIGSHRKHLPNCLVRSLLITVLTSWLLLSSRKTSKPGRRPCIIFDHVRNSDCVGTMDLHTLSTCWRKWNLLSFRISFAILPGNTMTVPVSL